MANWIQNVSLDAIKAGNHFDCGDRAVLIQIVDPAYEFPTPKHNFALRYRFEFLDIEKETGALSEFAITDEQAKEIALILGLALDERRNVVVHCHAGICRSGAVAEVGVMMGFTDSGAFRMPNILVKRKLMEALGWTYKSSDDYPLDMTDSGIIIATTKGIDK